MSDIPKHIDKAMDDGKIHIPFRFLPGCSTTKENWQRLKASYWREHKTSFKLRPSSKAGTTTLFNIQGNERKYGEVIASSITPVSKPGDRYE